MLSVRGVFKDGVARPVQPVDEQEGQLVIITFLRDTAPVAQPPSKEEDGWGALLQLVEECRVETGIADLAHQHDHYLYGRPKQE